MRKTRRKQGFSFSLAAIGRIVVYWRSVRGHRGPETKVARAAVSPARGPGPQAVLELANMSTVSAPARRRPASAPPAPSIPVRHGKCSLHLSIGGTLYRLHPITPPPGFRAVWSLRKQSPESSAVYQVAVEKGRQPACTCPDFEINGAVCKHLGALRALGLIPGRKARPAAARRSHARRLRGQGARPGRPVRRRVPVRHRPGSRRPSAASRSRRRAIPDCAACGEAFDPVVSRDPHFCGPCARKGPTND